MRVLMSNDKSHYKHKVMTIALFKTGPGLILTHRDLQGESK